MVDGCDNNCLLVMSLKDGRILDKVTGLSNPTAVAVDSTGAIYVGEVNGTNVKRFIKTRSQPIFQVHFSRRHVAHEVHEDSST